MDIKIFFNELEGKIKLMKKRIKNLERFLQITNDIDSMEELKSIKADLKTFESFYYGKL